jgi:hypothetical protein
VLALASATVGGLAWAKATTPQVGGSWQVKFTAVANTCGESGLVMGDELMKLTQSARNLGASLPLVSGLTGTLQDNGDFRLAKRKSETGVAGLRGSFEMTGTFKGDKVDVVLVGHYFVGKNKPYCEQSWNGTGVKK